MRAYIVRRLLLVIPTLFTLSILVFLSVRFIPGDVIDAMAGKYEYMGTVVDREALERLLGLDVPVYVQYGRWIGDIFLHGTLGKSLFGGAFSVEEKIIDRLPVTIELGVMAIVIGLVIALPVGIYSAIRQDTAADYLGRTFAVLGMSTPNFWLALMVMIYPALWWGWSPPMEMIPFTEDPLGNLGVFIIPSLILGTGHGCSHNADDAHHDAGGAPAGLYQDGLVKGSEGEGSYYETRRQECPHPGSYPDRPAAASPGRWRRYHGEHI